MAQRTIQECDLCKGEYDPHGDSYNLTFKKAGKKGTGHKYDLCPVCAEKIQQQLVAQSSEKLDVQWGFKNVPPHDLDEPIAIHNTNEPSAAERRAAMQEESERVTDPDDAFIAQKQRERAAQEAKSKESGTEAQPITEETNHLEMNRSKSGCRHLNKGRATLMTVGDKKGFYQRCTECKEPIPVRSAEEKAKYLNAKPDKGVVVGRRGD
jgi:RNA polymerase-binding transcription factor DksA